MKIFCCPGLVSDVDGMADSFDAGDGYDDRRLNDRGCITDFLNMYNDSGNWMWSSLRWEIASNDDRNSWYAFFGSVGALIIFFQMNCSRTLFVSTSLPSVNGGGTEYANEIVACNNMAITMIDSN